MLDLFRDMAEGILDLVGEDAFFDGSETPIKINVEHGVQLTGIGSEEAAYRGDLVVQRDVATIELKYGPKAGKKFIQNGRVYRLETLLEDNGVTRRFVILDMGPEVPPEEPVDPVDPEEPVDPVDPPEPGDDEDDDPYA